MIRKSHQPIFSPIYSSISCQGTENGYISDEIKNIIVSLKNSSSGWDDIHSKVLKRSYNYYIQVLTHIFNLSLTQGIFPQELELAE